MALPSLIEIVPLEHPVRAEITVPGSKSITNRALILAALAEGEVALQGALWSEDTQIMVECLYQLGFDVQVADDPAEFCNRTITVRGLGGKIPKAGTVEKPLELFVGNAGTAARFLAAFLCLGRGTYRLSGVPRMHERPQAALFEALRELGYRVESENGNDKLPVRIYGEGPKPGKCRVSIEKSSQFASALLLSAGMGGWLVGIVGENAEESPYVTMTLKLMEVFPKTGGTFQIEPDASSGSYFVGAGELLGNREGWPITVLDWPLSGWQIDTDFVVALPLHRVLARGGLLDDGVIKLGDSIMTAIVLAAFIGSGGEFVKFTHLGRLRVQECERVVALRTELTKCGAKVIEEGDTLTVWPSALHGAEIETYNDHRMAMCFAILGLKVPGIKIKNPSCVKKTFPNFFQKLAGSPPHGLGAAIWEIKDGVRTRQLSGDDLLAD
jgi:3-phosphoshikimate 1-carboxyvinyltransferase